MIENNNYGALNNEQETTTKIPSSNSAGSRQRFDIVEPNYNFFTAMLEQEIVVAEVLTLTVLK